MWLSDPMARRRPAHEGHRREDAVAEIGLGRRAQPGDGAGAGERFRLGRRHVGGMDGRPAVRQAELVQQHLDGAEARAGEAVLHLLHLLRDMDVDRRAGGRAAMTSRSISGVTARSEWGEMPTRGSVPLPV